MSSNTVENPVDASTSRLSVAKHVTMYVFLLVLFFPRSKTRNSAWIVALIILVFILGMPAWAYILLSVVFVIQYHSEENHPPVNSKTDISLATFAPRASKAINSILAPTAADQNAAPKPIPQQEDPSVTIAPSDLKAILGKDSMPSKSAAMPHRIQVAGDSLSCQATHKLETHRSLIPVITSAFIQPQSRVLPESQISHPSTVSCYGVNAPSTVQENSPISCNEKLIPLAVAPTRSQAKPLRTLSEQISTRTLSHPAPIHFAHPRTLSCILSHVTVAPSAVVLASLPSDNCIPILGRILPSIVFPEPAFGPLPVSHILPTYTLSDLSVSLYSCSAIRRPFH
jgi:hypothetical protein